MGSYQKTQNYSLIPNPETKWRKSFPIKVIKKHLKECFFNITFSWWVFTQFCLRIWNQHKILRFLVPILTYLKNKVFSSSYFVKKYEVLFCEGGGGRVGFLLKCHGLCPSSFTCTSLPIFCACQQRFIVFCNYGTVP